MSHYRSRRGKWKKLKATIRSAAHRIMPVPDEPPEELGVSPVRLVFIIWLGRAFLAAAGIAFVGMLFSLVTFAPEPGQVLAAIPSTASRTPSVTRTPAFTPTPRVPSIALLAGHSGGIDPGAICPDGLKEVDVTTDVAARARAILEARGYRVDILKEFDPKLSSVRRDYSPKAFLAIHADSCVYYASGYKVARATNSASPEEDDRLVRCVTAEYAASTRLEFHAGSITTDMTEYHALNEIDPKSPAAIIELGFLGSENNLLKNRRDIVALGVANGVDDFMRGEECKNPEAKR